MKECICALATPAGGAIGIIRLSGEKAIEITDKVFVPAGDNPLPEAKPNTIHYGDIKDKDGKTIDDVLVSVSFRNGDMNYTWSADTTGCSVMESAP